MALSCQPSALQPSFANDEESGIAPPEEKRAAKAPLSLFDDPKSVHQTAHLNARVLVPHAIRAVDTFAIYPYPVKPPVVKGPAAPIPQDVKSLKHLLLHSGYNARSHPDKPYPTGGYRWQYAFQAAVKKSGIGVPHSLVGAYQWIGQIMPYVMREAQAWNQFEKERYQRYEKAVAEFEKTRSEVEDDAVREGLYPMALRPRKGFASSTDATIPAGNWWLTCTRKAQGITYYWQIPFSAAPGENVNLTLTQPNALVITGGW